MSPLFYYCLTNGFSTDRSNTRTRDANAELAIARSPHILCGKRPIGRAFLEIKGKRREFSMLREADRTPFTSTSVRLASFRSFPVVRPTEERTSRVPTNLNRTAQLGRTTAFPSNLYKAQLTIIGAMDLST